ncbi:MAG: ArsR/SmtB family transcription factor [Bacillota bacterium]
MKIKHNILIDYLMSLSLYINKNFIDQILKQYDFELNNLLKNSFEIFDSDFSYYQINDLKLLFGNFINYVILVKLINKYDIETINELQKILDNLSSEKYRELIIKTLKIENNDISKNDLINAPFLLSIDTIDNYEIQAEIIYEYINQPEETLYRLKNILFLSFDKFKENIYIPNKKYILGILNQHKGEYEKLKSDFFKNRLHFIDDLNYNKLKKIYINIIASTGLVYDKDIGLLIYSHDMSKININKMKNYEYLEFIKAISDNKRIKIIKALNKESLCNSDLAKKLDLTAATISYHISMLINEDIITVKKGSYNKLMYSVNNEALDKRFEEAKNFLKK